MLTVDMDRPDVPCTLDSSVASVVVGLTNDDPGAAVRDPLAASCDLVLHRDDHDALAAVAATVEAQPLAATSLALLLRASENRSVDDGLHAESAVYSLLQASPEFAAWRAGRPVKQRPPDPTEVVHTARVGDELTLTLDRPHVRNALNTALRDGLLSGLAMAEADPSIAQVHLRGNGPTFCSGGDLDEFGSSPDPARAHLIRLSTSVGRAIDRLHTKVTVHMHGACAGSGIELPAFAGHVVATSGTTFALPEVQLGLVPGAGGTVSLPRRIGRHRTAELALTGRAIDAPTARSWGLVDEIDDELRPEG